MVEERGHKQPNGHDIDSVPHHSMTTSALETKLRSLREKSNEHSQELTQRLASSQSGQNLLHIGTSLSSLPPDLHSLLTQLHPILSACEKLEKEEMGELQKLVKCANDIRLEQRRMEHSAECADLYLDLLAAERDVKRDVSFREAGVNFLTSSDENAGDDAVLDELDHVASLERSAHTTLCLVKDLEASTAQVSALTAVVASTPSNSEKALPSLRTPLEGDTERSQFLMKLSTRIRRLESNTVTALVYKMEQLLNRLQQMGQEPTPDNEPSEKDLLLMLGHTMRGLALLGRGKEVESVFARVAIMPLIRSKVSMGRLDEGGSRGECAGLPSLMENMVESIATAYGPVLRFSESMFQTNTSMGVDLVTAGVWVPIATALMADAGIKMAIFSPGIASILQANYIALDSFLAKLADTLLSTTNGDNNDDGASSEAKDSSDLYYRPSLSREAILAAQERIYMHPKTAEFSKKWNLPIYYQLRFGECCNRLNKAVTQTQGEGWIAEVYSGTPEGGEKMRNEIGFGLTFFLELYDILLGLWKPDVILRPLAHRFLRGAMQLVGRALAFIRDGMEGTLKFGGLPLEDGSEGEGAPGSTTGTPLPPSRAAYVWSESEENVAAVAWELTLLEASIQNDYLTTICTALSRPETSEAEMAELKELSSEILEEALHLIKPLIDSAWNGHVVKILTAKCSAPLAAVKGVAATYRMTNRPPPTQASPFVGTILRPLKGFVNEFQNRTPKSVGLNWKQQIVVAVADRYSVAVAELIATVERTEAALQNRNRNRRAMAGGMSDGEKVKLQLLLDYKAFVENVREVGINPDTVVGIEKLKTLTSVAEALLEKQRNGS